MKNDIIPINHPICDREYHIKNLNGDYYIRFIPGKKIGPLEDYINEIASDCIDDPEFGIDFEMREDFWVSFWANKNNDYQKEITIDTFWDAVDWYLEALNNHKGD